MRVLHSGNQFVEISQGSRFVAGCQSTSLPQNASSESGVKPLVASRSPHIGASGTNIGSLSSSRPSAMRCTGTTSSTRHGKKQTCAPAPDAPSLHPPALPSPREELEMAHHPMAWARRRRGVSPRVTATVRRLGALTWSGDGSTAIKSSAKQWGSPW